MAIKWNPAYSVGIPKIDDQHKYLVKTLNDLLEAMKARDSERVGSEILVNMVNYTKFHFSTEEDYFDKYNYPDTEQHKQEHAIFVAKVSEFQEKAKINKFLITLEILDFLKNWLVEHISRSDKAYTEFLVGKGINQE